MADEDFQGAEAMHAIFADFQKHITNEQSVREVIKEKVHRLEELSREILAKMQLLHNKSSPESIAKLCSLTREKFGSVQEHYRNLADVIPDGQFYRYNDHWKFATQRLVFLASLVVYLETETLIARETVASMLGVKVNWRDGFHLDLDDFLIGVLQLASELSRLAVNCVRFGDYKRPSRIASFLSELDMSYRLLNMKNDALRKRYDALKYDLKKTEEVVYDLSIRGLVPKSEQ